MDYLDQLLHDALIQAEKDGKEPFDFVKFAGLYAHDTGSCERLKPDSSPAVQSYYMRMYYEYPKILTIVDFARFLDEMDLTS